MVHIVLIVLLCTAGITTAAPLTTIQAALSSASNAADLVKKIFGRTTSVSVSEIQKDIGFNRIMRAAVHLKGTARSHAGTIRMRLQWDKSHWDGCDHSARFRAPACAGGSR